jgi:hypothetical protein
MAAMRVTLGHDIWDMTTAMTLDKITKTDQSVQVGLTGQLKQLGYDRSERTGCQNITTMTRFWAGELWTRAGQLGQERRDRIGGQDRRDRTDRTGQIGQSNRDGTTMAGQSRYGNWDRTTETGQPGQVNLERTAWTNRTERTSQDIRT